MVKREQGWGVQIPSPALKKRILGKRFFLIGVWVVWEKDAEAYHQ